jgi:hypothetical protein
VAQVIECLPSKWEALISNPNITSKLKKRERTKRQTTGGQYLQIPYRMKNLHPEHADIKA